MDEPHIAERRALSRLQSRARKTLRGAGDWEWSSVRAHLRRRRRAGRRSAVLAIAPRFGDLLELSPATGELDGFESLGANGRPLGDEAFLAFAERKLGEACARESPDPSRGQRPLNRNCVSCPVTPVTPLRQGIAYLSP